MQYDERYSQPGQQAYLEGGSGYTYIHGLGFQEGSTRFFEKKSLKTAGNKLALLFFLYLFLSNAIYLVLYLLYTGIYPLVQYFSSAYWMSELSYQMILLIDSLTALPLSVLLYAKLTGTTLRGSLPMQPVGFKLPAAAAMACLGITAITSMGSNLIRQLFGSFGIYTVDSSSELPYTAIGWILYLINIVLLPALLEEFALRGVVLHSLRRFGDVTAVVVSAAFFSLLHMDATSFPTIFVAGLAMGFLVIKTGSLWVSIIMHGVNNLLAVLAEVGAGLVPLEKLPLYYNCIYVGYLILGLIGGCWLLQHLDMGHKEESQIISWKEKLSTIFLTAGIVLAVLAVLAQTMLRVRVNL